MSEPWNDWPLALDWNDEGRAIEAELSDGSIVSGRLYCEDVMTDSDGDEFPFWVIQIEGRENASWAERWRFVP